MRAGIRHGQREQHDECRVRDRQSVTPMTVPFREAEADLEQLFDASHQFLGMQKMIT